MPEVKRLNATPDSTSTSVTSPAALEPRQRSGGAAPTIGKTQVTARHIRVAGVIALLAGLITAALIFCTAQPEEKLGILGIDIRTNRQRGQLERMGGKGYVMLSDLDEWFASLWHGRRLGYTVGALSFLAFLLSRGVARVHADHEQVLVSQAKAQADPSGTPPPDPRGKALAPPPISVTPPATQEPRHP